MIQFLQRLLIAIIWIVASPVGFGLILTPWIAGQRNSWKGPCWQNYNPN